MELEIYEALTAANVPNDKARAVAESINKKIDRRYELHARQLATRGDISEPRQQSAEMEARLLRRSTTPSDGRWARCSRVWLQWRRL